VPVKRTILVVEDEKDIRELVRFHLEQEGYTVREADTGESALAQVAADRPALVVLDIMLPGTDGIEVCRRMRSAESTHSIPIIMLTARAAEVDRVIGLEMGADDYITKPFSPREMVARVRAVLRRTHGEEVPQPHEVFERGRLRMDFDTYEVFIAGQPASPLREFELPALRPQPYRVYDRLQLLDPVWGQTYVEPRTVDVHIRRLRKRIERDDASPELIVTVRGVDINSTRRAGVLDSPPVPGADAGSPAGHAGGGAPSVDPPRATPGRRDRLASAETRLLGEAIPWDEERRSRTRARTAYDLGSYHRADGDGRMLCDSNRVVERRPTSPTSSRRARRRLCRAGGAGGRAGASLSRMSPNASRGAG
jgi:DNA-binding response OmpR family regulator